MTGGECVGEGRYIHSLHRWMEGVATGVSPRSTGTIHLPQAGSAFGERHAVKQLKDFAPVYSD